MMKMRKKASLVAATAAVTFGSVAMAADYTFTGAYSSSDAYIWDYSNPIFTLGTPDLVAFPSPPPLNNAIFGAATLPNTPAAPTISTSSQQAIDVANVSVGNLTVGTNQDPAAGNSSFTFVDYSSGSLTLNGDFTKTGTQGVVKFAFDFGGALNLSDGNHTFKIQDSPGSATAEVRVEATVTGSGNLIVDNGDFEQFGQLHLQRNNSYTGQTILNKGMIVINANGALGAIGAASNTVIQNAGALALGFGDNNSQLGAPNAGINVAEDITISRSIYTGDPAFDKYQFAIEVNGVNGANTTSTFSGNITVDSVDARLNSNSSLIINKPILYSAAHTADGILNLGGNFAGYVYLTADNSTGPMANLGVKISGGVELVVTNHNQIGGASAPINFNGGYIQFPAGTATFGTHVINATTFNGGIDVPAGETFTVDREIGEVGSTSGTFGKRGTGTLNFNSPVTLGGNGTTYWDGGIVNVNSAVVLPNIHLRSPQLNISSGSLTLAGNGAGNYVSLGQDSTGTNGGPDIAVINLTGTGVLSQTGTGDPDFNISDNANTRGTINISGNAVLNTSGRTYLGKNAGAQGFINQSGGTVNINRTGDFALVIGRDQGTGTYTKTGGTLNVKGEMFVGQGAAGTGTFTQTGGTTTVNNWFVIGREGAAGNVLLTGGTTFNKTGGGNVQIDAGAANGQSTPSTLTVDNATFNVNGELQVGTDNAVANGTLNVRNGSTITVNNWFSVGRAGATGTLNLEGGSITKSGGGNTYVGEGANQNSVMNISGGSLTVTGGEFWVANAGSSKGVVNLSGSGALSVNNWLAVGRNGTAQGEFNMTGGTLTKTGNGRFVIGSGGTASGIFTQSAGLINSNATSVGESGTGTAKLSGGTANLGDLIVKEAGPAGTLEISGTAAVTAATVTMAVGGNGTSTINLSGGSFLVADIKPGASATATRTFSWTGGNLATNSFTLTSPLNNSGAGTFFVGGDGTIAAAAVPVTGGYIQSAAGTLDIDIASLLSFDTITAGASSTVNGLLNVDVLGSYDTSGQFFDVLTVTSGTLTGLPTLAGPDAGLFTVSVVNDNTLRLTSTVAPIPEPTSLAALCLGAAAALRRKRRV